MPMELRIGPDVISSYRRLAYTPWHAIAEFVDNSTQSYFDNRAALDAALKSTNELLRVSIAYDRGGFLRISDNAMGMSYDELQRALHVGLPPQNTSGRSKYGMGLKTAACWIGNTWTIRTKKLGEPTEHSVTINVDQIASGQKELPYVPSADRPGGDHYTIVEITDHNKRFQGRTLGKIKEFLSSMYREDFRRGLLTLEWDGVPLTWQDLDGRLLVGTDGNRYKKEFAFDVDGKRVAGWVGILDHGSRADAGFSIIHCGRVIRGWPDSWRPSTLYGQFLGSNDLVNQRLVGEIHLDDFEVSHTKDNIQWFGDQEEKVEDGLKEHCGDYRQMAQQRRKGGQDQRGPSDIETATAVDEFKKELMSPEMVDQIEIGPLPPAEAVATAMGNIVRSVSQRRTETFSATLGDLVVKVYLAGDLSPNDPYVATEAAKPSEVVVVVNMAHPHWGQLRGSEGVLNYLRECTYDAIAEWQARGQASRIDPDTIKLLKDKLLRVPLEIEQHGASPEEEVPSPDLPIV